MTHVHGHTTRAPGAPHAESPAASDIVVRNDPARSRYEALVRGELAGFSEYHAQPGLITVMHTEVEPAFEGRGIGSALVRDMLDDVRREDAKVLPVCPFVKAFLQRHREYADLAWRP